MHEPGSLYGIDPVGGRDLYIGAHIVQNPLDPLQHYQNFFRVSGSTSRTEHISVDFDFDNRVWKMFNMTEPDIKNMWYAVQYDGGVTNFRSESFGSRNGASPVIHQQTSIIPADILIKNGSWSKSTTRSNHSLIIPELELQIPHW